MYVLELKFAIETAKGAGEILRKHFGAIEPDKPRDAVKGLLSIADLESDKYICDKIE